MSDSSGFFSRLGSWFKGDPKTEGDLPLQHEADQQAEQAENGSNGSGHSVTGTALLHGEASRSTFLRPWAKRDAAIVQLQDGFNALTGLMGAVRDSLEKQSDRQGELMEVLSNLPVALKSIPESSAIQTETLKAIAEQIKYQNTQQAKLGEILEKVSETGGDHKEILDSLRERVENLGEHDKTIADSLNNVGSAMQSVSRNSQTSAQVLEQMRDNVNSREGELQRMLHKQSTRFTTMLAIAIFLSVAALVAVSVIGYLLITKPH